MLLGACDAPSTPPATTATPRSTAQIGGTLRVALADDVATLDPHNAAEPSSLQVTGRIFETLVEHDAAGRIAPKLAQAWTVSADGTTWTIALRKGVKFHDGTDLDAAAVVANIERARLTTHPLRGAGAERFRPFAALFDGFDEASAITSVAAKDATTVVVTTRAPFGPFLEGLAAPSSAIVSLASMRDDLNGWAGPGSRGAAGTGPFAFRSWESSGQVTLERNGAYWGKDQGGVSLPYLERVVFRPLRDEAARIAELRAGTIDVVRDVSPGAAGAVRADPNLQLVARPPFGVVYLGMSQTVRPFDRPEVRRAVAAAVDEQAIATAAYVGDAKPATQFVAPGNLGYDDTVVDFARLDAGAAKRLLADAGFPNGFNAELAYPPAWRAAYPDPRRLAESVAADLAKIGIAAAPRASEAATFRADARAGRFALWLDEWTGPSADPDAFLGALFGTAGAVTLELLRHARAETDETKRSELYKQVTKLVQQDVVAIPLVHVSPPLAASRKVRGLAPQRSGGDPLGGVWLGR